MHRLVLSFVLLISCLSAVAQQGGVRNPTTKSGNTNAMRLQYNGGNYAVYVVNYPRQNIKMYWKNDKGVRLKSLGNLQQFLATKQQKLVFATNGGMYTTESNPVGLYIENGKKLKGINLKKGPETNFYMQPNGVFYTTAKHAGVCRSEDFAAIKDKVLYATQSGPMLVVDGQINPLFKKGSPNINIRSAVGTDKEGRVFFVISEGLVSFYDIAGLFTEKLRCTNVLFLDGAISRMYLPALNRSDNDGEFGVMIGVTEQ